MLTKHPSHSLSLMAQRMKTPVGASSIWVCGGASGLDKRQCTVQLTIFSDGEPRVKPLIIFQGKGKRIAFHEKFRYVRRFHVAFQENAWCDEPTMDMWVRQLWKPACSGNMLLILDVHKAQKKQMPSLTCLTAATQHQCTYLLEQPASFSPLMSRSTNLTSPKWRN